MKETLITYSDGRLLGWLLSNRYLFLGYTALKLVMPQLSHGSVTIHSNRYNIALNITSKGALFNKMKITEKENDLLIYLFVYRGMRAKDLVVFDKKTSDYSLSDEKSAYNYLAKMKRKGLIKSQRLQGVSSLGSMYYLSKSGLELIKENLNISVGQNGNGMLPIHKLTKFWDIPYQYQIPPLKQNEHYLMTIEFYKQLNMMDEIPVHITNFYANLTYVEDKQVKKLKPDAAILLNKNFYAIEIDRGTESNEQLYDKFLKYKTYHDYCKNLEDEKTKLKVHTILFVVESKKRKYGIKRRWTNVLSAFFKAFGADFPPINLIMVPMDETVQTLEFEKQRKDLENKMYLDLKDSLNSQGYIHFESFNGNALAFNEQKQFKSLHVLQHLEYESNLYKDKYEHHMYIQSLKPRYLYEEGKQFHGKEYLNGIGYWKAPHNVPQFAEGIENMGLQPSLLEKLKVANYYFEKYQITK